MKKLIALFCLAAGLVLLVPGVPRAQTGFSIRVSPSKIELNGPPGSSQRFAINVINMGTATQTMRVYLNDYFIKPDNDFVFEPPGHYSYSCAKWLSTNPASVVVAPGQTAQKVFTLTVPKKAEPGGHYAVIFFEQVEAQGQQVTAKGRIGVITLVTVPGRIIREGKITSVQVTSSWFRPTKKLPLLPVKTIHARIVFYNSGNVHLTVKGKLTYVPTFGWGSGTVTFGEITVLPKTTRYLEKDISSPPFLGSFKVQAEAYYGPSLDVFDTTRTGATSFSIYPLVLVLILLVLLAIIIVLVMLAKRRRARRARRAKKEEKEEKEEATLAAGSGEEAGPEQPSADTPEAAEDGDKEEPQARQTRMMIREQRAGKGAHRTRTKKQRLRPESRTGVSEDEEE